MKIIDFTSELCEGKYLPSQETIQLLEELPKWASVYVFCPRVLDGRHIDFDGCHEELMKIYSRVPVCLVTSDMADKKVEVEFEAYSEIVTVPHLEGNTSMSNVTNHGSGREECSSCLGNTLTIVDPLGVYVRRKSRSVGNRQVVFLYVDKILNAAGSEHYSTLFSLTALHEMMHVMMDVDAEIEATPSESKNYRLMTVSRKDFDKCEEVLANALAMMFLETNCSDSEWQFAEDFVEHQPRPYCQMAEVSPCHQRLLIHASNWFLFKQQFERHKSNRFITNNNHIHIPNIVRYKQFEGLTSFVFPAGITEICGAFLRCFTGVKYVSIPEGVQTICDFAFGNCNSLQSIVLPASVEHIKGSAFCDCTHLEAIYVNEENKIYESRQNCIIKKENKELVIGAGRFPIIPDGCEGIGDYAFCGSHTRQCVRIPDTVKYIGKHAFCNCEQLQTMCIPESVQLIDWCAFYSCGNLEGVTFKGTPQLNSQCFAQCRNLKRVRGLGNQKIYAADDAFYVSDKTAVFEFPE